MYKGSPYVFKDKHSYIIYKEFKDIVTHSMITHSYAFEKDVECHLMSDIQEQLEKDGYTVEIDMQPNKIFHSITDYTEYYTMYVYIQVGRKR